MSSQLFRSALAHHQAGHFNQAEALYLKILQLEPNHPDALHLLGALARQAGNQARAADLIGKAINAKPTEPVFYNSMGLVMRDMGQLDGAIGCYRNSVYLKPDYSEAYYNLANVLQLQGKLEDAVENYRKALSLKPDDAEAYNNLGNALQAQGKLEEAVASYAMTIAIKPYHAEAHSNLGNVLQTQGKAVEAVASYRQALTLKPNSIKANYNLGVALQSLGELTAAIECFRKAITINPDFIDAHYDLGNALRIQGDLVEAVEEYRKVISLDAGNVQAYSDLGSALRFRGKIDESLASYRKALSIKPDFADARWKLAMAQIPIIAESHEQIETSRKRLAQELDDLNDWFDADRMALGYQVVGTSMPFYLAYQEQNNREMLSRYGRLCVRLMGHWQDRQTFHSLSGEKGSVIRVGFVSAHIRRHSVWDAIVKGWFQHMDRDRFEFHVFHTGAKQDDETGWARARSASFVDGKRTLSQWVESILEKHVDVMIYPEIGMDQMTVKLASLRLARIQIAAWGHPETSGLPTMDYYLSAECLEPAGAQSNYSENLICLPHLGCHYHPADVTVSDPGLERLGIAGGIPLLLCPGTPFKYAPEHDHVLVDIAKRLGKCQFIFFTYRIPELSAQLHRRLEMIFSRANLDFNDYGAFIPWLERSAFFGLMKRTDVLLDTIGFSGFNTAIQAIECCLPVVAKDGQFMRGRLASGILRRMGMTELIASADEEYIDLAVRLAQDATYRQDIRTRIEAARSILFDDIAPVQALEDFLVNVCKQGSGHRPGE